MAALPQAPDPARDWLIFDGVCRLCAGAIRFVARYDRDRRCRFVPWQSALGQALLERYGIDRSRIGTVVLVRDDVAYTHSDAALLLSDHLYGAGRLLGLLRLVPRRWRDGVYRLIAGRRYRLFGRRAYDATRDANVESRLVERPEDASTG